MRSISPNPTAGDTRVEKIADIVVRNFAVVTVHDYNTAGGVVSSSAVIDHVVGNCAMVGMCVFGFVGSSPVYLDSACTTVVESAL